MMLAQRPVMLRLRGNLFETSGVFGVAGQGGRRHHSPRCSA
jgi:hypothetical protein